MLDRNYFLKKAELKYRCEKSAFELAQRANRGETISHQEYMNLAHQAASKSLQEGGVPVGGVLIYHDQETKEIVVVFGHNRLIQKNTPIRHGETDVFHQAHRRNIKVKGRGLTPQEWKNATLYTTLSPCYMCAGSIKRFGVQTVVIGENTNFQESEAFLKSHDITLIQLNDSTLIKMMRHFIIEHPDIWGPDITEVV